jgi:hypothetical protein
MAGWLQAGITERSRSLYNSPILCVLKKEGQGLRCVLDYRRVNHSSFSERPSKLLEANGLVASGRRERADVHRRRVSAQPEARTAFETLSGR